jgi:hypothetical protein
LYRIGFKGQDNGLLACPRSLRGRYEDGKAAQEWRSYLGRGTAAVHQMQYLHIALMGPTKIDSCKMALLQYLSNVCDDIEILPLASRSSVKKRVPFSDAINSDSGDNADDGDDLSNAFSLDERSAPDAEAGSNEISARLRPGSVLSSDSDESKSLNSLNLELKGHTIVGGCGLWVDMSKNRCFLKKPVNAGSPFSSTSLHIVISAIPFELSKNWLDTYRNRVDVVLLPFSVDACDADIIAFENILPSELPWRYVDVCNDDEVSTQSSECWNNIVSHCKKKKLTAPIKAFLRKDSNTASEIIEQCLKGTNQAGEASNGWKLSNVMKLALLVSTFLAGTMYYRYDDIQTFWKALLKSKLSWSFPPFTAQYFTAHKLLKSWF